VATSRRRERELARRRFERRRQAELERRAKAKKRNTVVGAVVATFVVIGALVGIGFAIVGGNGHSKAKSLKAGASTGASSSPTASASPAPPAPTKCAKIAPNPPAAGEPKVPNVSGKAPTKLVVKDITTGHGAVAKSGDSLTVQYVGLSCSSGKPFDASYTDGAKNKEFTFTLGKGSVIPGWDQGLVGMKVGGLRELVIPAALGYGTQGSPPTINGNETLIFVIHLVKT
jgi:peptidylprolyl isomerase